MWTNVYHNCWTFFIFLIIEINKDEQLLQNIILQKPEILLNGKIPENVYRVSDDVFEIGVDENEENFISARILSTVEKYNSELSDQIKCL